MQDCFPAFTGWVFSPPVPFHRQKTFGRGKDYFYLCFCTESSLIEVLWLLIAMVTQTVRNNKEIRIISVVKAQILKSCISCLSRLQTQNTRQI